MYLQSLKLFHFRNYEPLEIKFNPHLNIIYGKNGSGKTNLVEAIYVLALTKSFRGVQDLILITSDYSLSKIEGNVYFPGNNVDNYRILLTKDGKKVKINQTKITKLSEYITKIPVILFHPNDLKIIKDTPSIRRKEMNISISQYNLEYLKNLTVYNKLLKQRNAYLKKMAVNANCSASYLDILTDKLISYGMKIYDERQKFFDNVNIYIENLYEKITTTKGLKINYKSSYCNLTSEALKKLYKDNLAKDLMFGKTHIGIHTDDLEFLLNNYDLKSYGSEGQQKNAIIAYKFCELEILKKEINKYPILILDDLFSELDIEKIANIFNLLKKDIQTFITTTEIDKMTDFLESDYKSFLLSSGKILEEIEHEK